MATEPEEREDEEDLEEEEVAPPPEEREGLRGASKALAHLPGYDKLLEDQLGVIEELRQPFPDRAAYKKWILRLFGTGLGRRPFRGRLLFSEVVVPFLVEAEKGKTPAGEVLRRLLTDYVIWQLDAPAQRTFARRAEEEKVRDIRYLEKPAVRPPWGKVAR